MATNQKVGSSNLFGRNKKDRVYPYPFYCVRKYEKLRLEFDGFAYGRSETSPDSEEIERTATKLQKRNFPSVEQIQDESLRA